jgi:SAM-dependent methyltransferase
VQELEYVISCPVCNNENSKSMFKKHGLAYRKCRQCGLVYASPRPSPRIIESRVEMFAGQMPSDLQFLQDRVNFQSERINILKSFNLKGSLLDFGSGDGSFVRAARIAGYDAVGIEKAKGATEYAKKNYDVIIYPGDIKYNFLSRNTFDLITMWDVLEHLPDPVDICNILFNLLSKNGKLIILTPQSKGLSAKLKKSDYWVFGPNDHLCLFSMKTILLLMQKVGLHVDIVLTKDLVPWNPPEYKGKESPIAKVWKKLATNESFLVVLSKFKLGDWLLVVANKL